MWGYSYRQRTCAIASRTHNWDGSAVSLFGVDRLSTRPRTGRGQVDSLSLKYPIAFATGNLRVLITAGRQGTETKG